MSDTTITPEERAAIRKVFGGNNYDAGNTMIRMLDALEQAEARAEKAEDEKTALEEDMEATEKSLKEYSGFFEELCARLKERFPKQYADLEGDEYGEDAFGVHELFDHVIDPVIEGAKEQAEANVARLTKMVDWLAGRCAEELGFAKSLFKERKATVSEWKEAARRAVADAESSEKAPCPACKGKGGAEYEPGLLSYVCEVCGGTGQIEGLAVAAGEGTCPK